MLKGRCYGFLSDTSDLRVSRGLEAVPLASQFIENSLATLGR